MLGRVGFTTKIAIPVLLRKMLGVYTKQTLTPYPFCSGSQMNKTYFAVRNSYADVCARWWHAMKSSEVCSSYEKLLEGCFDVGVGELKSFDVAELTPTIGPNRTANYCQYVQYLKRWIYCEPEQTISMAHAISVVEDGSSIKIDDGNQRYHATKEAGIGRIMAAVWRVI